MERVPEVLQLPVIVEGRRPLALELQPLEKLDFLRGRRAAERRILKEFLEPGLFDEVLFGFQFDKLKFLYAHRGRGAWRGGLPSGRGRRGASSVSIR